MAVVGAGLGGLAAAIGLQRVADVEVTVFEQAGQLGEIGAGVGLAPNGQRVLNRLGVLDDIRRVGATYDGPGRYIDTDGRLVGEVPWADSSGQYQTLGMHRADFVDVMVRALAPETIRVGHRLTAIDASDADVRLMFQNGESSVFDAVVGADGTHSVVRESMIRTEDPVYSGFIAYRGVLDAKNLPADWPMRNQIWMGMRKHFMCYPIRQREQFNFVGFVPSSRPLRESWSARGDVDELVAEFGPEWDPNLRDFISRIDETFWWGLYDREPLRSWSRGRVTLLGDAAHTMLPHAGQGVNQALEDAVALAIVLREANGPAAVSEAFRRYAAVRMQRTAILQASSRRSGTQLASQAEFENLGKRDAEVRAGRDFRRSFVFDYDAAAVADKTVNRMRHQQEGGSS
ncbi:FAD-dependent monooxygenase [Actinomycetospora sp. NBRC 106378]|uniref:FAD-dependent monooxygenase n=1 Tax=Actinomycetospora sp. NBRC 106378 TaxID=3032208 RepID=UPI00255412B2|nr:FAD-dependent monooxygenase [Actinomycetospora sp. NBRC 106378]